MIAEIPPVQSMEAVDLHLRSILQQLHDIKQGHAEMMRLLATKQEVAELRSELEAKIKNGSFSAFLRRLTEIAVAITAVCTALGFVFAVVKFIGPKL